MQYTSFICDCGLETRVLFTNSYPCQCGKINYIDVKQSYNDIIKKRGAELWVILHSMKNPSIIKVLDWIDLIPSYGCDCQSFAREYIEKNPPTFDNFFYWTWKFHDEVDIKTGDTRISFEEAKAYWSKPSIANMAYNLIADTAKYVKSGFENCSQEEIDKRLSICNECPHLDNGRCNQCGCFVNIKAVLKSSSCPLDKWPSNDVF